MNIETKQIKGFIKILCSRAYAENIDTSMLTIKSESDLITFTATFNESLTFSYTIENAGGPKWLACVRTRDFLDATKRFDGSSISLNLGENVLIISVDDQIHTIKKYSEPAFTPNKPDENKLFSIANEDLGKIRQTIPVKATDKLRKDLEAINFSYDSEVDNESLFTISMNNTLVNRRKINPLYLSVEAGSFSFFIALDEFELIASSVGRSLPIDFYVTEDADTFTAKCGNITFTGSLMNYGISNPNILIPRNLFEDSIAAFYMPDFIDAIKKISKDSKDITIKKSGETFSVFGSDSDSPIEISGSGDINGTSPESITFMTRGLLTALRSHSGTSIVMYTKGTRGVVFSTSSDTNFCNLLMPVIRA